MWRAAKGTGVRKLFIEQKPKKVGKISTPSRPRELDRDLIGGKDVYGTLKIT